MKLQLRHQVGGFADRVDFLLFVQHEDRRDVVQSLEFKPVKFGEMVSTPTMTLYSDEARDFLRSVMDVGWEMGVRPTGYDNDLGATKHHLDDMRRIVFKKLGMRDD